MVVKTEDNRYIDTEKAAGEWKCQQDFDGSNFIYRSPGGSQWVKETLYKSAKGNYYIVRESANPATPTTARFVSHDEAAGWLRLNDYDLPDDLKEYDPTE